MSQYRSGRAQQTSGWAVGFIMFAGLVATWGWIHLIGGMIVALAGWM